LIYSNYTTDVGDGQPIVSVYFTKRKAWY